MTTKEFERLKEHWDSKIRKRHYYIIEPFDIYVCNILKPEGDYFISVTRDVIRLIIKDDFTNDTPTYTETTIPNTIKIHYKKVQRISGSGFSNKYIHKWEQDDWKVEVREDKLKQLGI